MSMQTRDLPSAVRPTKLTLFLRAWWVWQAVRFIVINLRMAFMILKSHQGRLTLSRSARKLQG